MTASVVQSAVATSGASNTSVAVALAAGATAGNLLVVACALDKQAGTITGPGGFTQIANNAGVDGGVICEKVGELSGNMGYNAANGKFEDLVKTGIIDPTKVTRSALQNAASVATLLLTSDALIAEKPKADKGGKGGHSHDDYDMD